MKLDILLFGITTDLVGTSNLEIEVPASSSVAHFKNEMTTKFPQLTNIQTYAIAVNESYATDETLLQENDVVAIIPPVSGG
ncbi:molybdopterin converting factor subunit 1 [Flavobacteriaceae bacterium S356]|uniref:Molybdopterin synthase sulfur carrier subunit n=1 Tax=Asprobacillus argus TaxID=3076534 RepID=A0ABU3LGH5_9FLAO|nr:molybdopterin converting factor subunit 1 [Flavobacteriaceae bacterium S356]